MSSPHYSPIFQAGDFYFISGQLPIIDRASLTMPDGIYGQTILCLQKAEALLIDRGLDRHAIVKTTCFITDGEGWDEANRAYADFFGHHKPARSIVPVPSLHFGCLVEIEAVGFIRNG